MARKEILWAIAEQLYFVYYPIISYRRINVYRVENGYGKIPLEQCCRWDVSHIHEYNSTYCTK